MNTSAPLPIYLAPAICCSYCNLMLYVKPLDTSRRRMLVEHFTLSDYHMEEVIGEDFQWCPNNGRKWVMEYRHPMIWEVDPVTGGYDEMSGRVI